MNILVIMEYFLYAIAFCSIFLSFIFEDMQSIFNTAFIVSVVLIVLKYVYIMVKEVNRRIILSDAREKNSYVILPIKNKEIIYFNDYINKKNHMNRRILKKMDKEYKIDVEYVVGEEKYILTTVFYASDQSINFFEDVINRNIVTTIKVLGKEIEKTKVFEFDMDEFISQTNISMLSEERKFEEKYTKITKVSKEK